MQIKVLNETMGTVRFQSNCPTCSELCDSMVYALYEDWLNEPEHSVNFICPTDGQWTETGSIAFVWTPSA